MSVPPTKSGLSDATQSQGARSHHLQDGSFTNPWDSFRLIGRLELARLFIKYRDGKQCKVPDDKALLGAQVIPIDWKKVNRPPSGAKIQATWLGHAAILLQIKGRNILFDPIFSHRCSPFSFMGPARYTEPPCKISELPKIDVCCISHNHYDHLDIATVRNLGPDVTFYVPLGNKSWFASNFPTFHKVYEADWWDSFKYEDLEIVATPAQHFTGRGLFDTYKTLWSSWVIRTGERSIFFGGDTGYRSIKEGEESEEITATLPVCPAFREIGERYGPFDLSFIPIGAYSPRVCFSPVHCSPADSVCVHQDVRSKKSIGIHWNTFVLTDEPVSEPPRAIAIELRKKDLSEKEFGVINIGETIEV